MNPGEHPADVEAEQGSSSTPGTPPPHRVGKSKAHPLSEQCTAHSKKTGERCKKRVIGGGVCPQHGGRAPQVAAKREARILAGEAALAAAGSDEELRRDPRSALLAAAQDADVILQRLKHQVKTGTIEPALLQALGDWLDRTSRLSKVVIDARIDEQRVQLEQTQARLVGVAVTEALTSIGATLEQRDTFTRVMLARLRGDVQELESRRPSLSVVPGEVQ